MVQKPPRKVSIPYYLFGARVPEEWRDWVVCDIRSAWWPLRSSLIPLGIIAAIVLTVAARDRHGAVMFVAFVPAIGNGVAARRRRAQAIRYQQTGKSEGYNPANALWGLVFGLALSAVILAVYFIAK